MVEPAAYQVIARRYRPQKFGDLVGQEHVARGLVGAIDSGRVGHAYLFTVLAESAEQVPHASTRKHSSAQTVNTANHATHVITVKQ
jgi:hypothetical protein